MEEPNNDIDTETLQAQIDLAMAHAQNLVASWLPGSSSSMTQPSSRAAETEAELQALLRRPPRLGVGAPIPETHAPAQARLVQKLQGGKKRARELANDAHADAVGVKKKEDGEDESSAEESRIGTTRKRTIIDPFETAGKKRKKRRKEAEEIKEAADGTAQETCQMAGEGTTGALDAMAGPTPKKKKKKKKSHLPEGQETVEHNAAITHNGVVAQDEGASTQSPQETLEEKPLGASEASDPVATSGLTFSTSPSLPGGLPIQRSPTSAISTGNATLPFPTILNLTGPPSMAPNGTESHPRKKRRRRKKKKNPATCDPP